MKAWTLVLGCAALLGLSGCEQLLEWMYGEENYPCERIYDPVCGRDGHTYGSACRAEQVGVRIAYVGECDSDSCLCDDVYAPVCDRRGNEYPNRCEARCMGVRNVVRCGDDVGRPGREPPPRDDCMCPEYYNPVCTHDGRKYSNRCFAMCDGEEDFFPCGPNHR